MRNGIPSPARSTRRQFLRRSAAVAAGFPLAAGVLAACGGRPPGIGTLLPLARKDRPVTWPIHEDDPPIASGLPIERGSTLKVYEWREYLSKGVLDDFARRYRRYDVGYEVSSFLNRDEALARIRAPGSDFDVFFPTIDQIGGLVEARLLQPLSHEYLPNLQNLWPAFTGPERPFYDGGLRYTLPYTVFSTGIGWRTDLVHAMDAPDALDDPYDVFWNAAYRGRIGLYDDYREVIGMALLRDGVADVDTAEASALDRATNHLVAMAGAVDVRLTTEGAYEGLPRGQFAVHQAWSGDMLSAPRLGEADALGTTRLLRYRWPSTGVVGCDLIAILSQGRHPVLAHAFLNHLLDVEVAMRNFGWNGYQPPLSGATREAFSDPRAPWSVPENLLDAILTREDFERGRMLLALSPVADAEWLSRWDRFRSLARPG